MLVSFECSNNDCLFIGGEQGCFSIVGMPTEFINDIDLTIVFDIVGEWFFNGVSIPIEIFFIFYYYNILYYELIFYHSKLDTLKSRCWI